MNVPMAAENQKYPPRIDQAIRVKPDDDDAVCIGEFPCVVMSPGQAGEPGYLVPL